MNKAVAFSLLSVLAVAACGATPSASPTPGASPGQSPTPGQSPSPGQSPPPGQSPMPTDQPTPAPSPANSPPPGGISHPTGADEVVLQFEVAGGFVPVDVIVTQMPQFTLYGDGTVIWRPLEDAGQVGDMPGLTRLLQGRMDEDSVQALLAFALGQGRLAGARENYPQNSCADCSGTIFRVNAADMSKEVTVDALGVEEQMDRADRAGFLVLAEWLNNFDEQARNGIAGDVVLYDPPMYRVVLTQAASEIGEFDEWPWDDVTIDDFTPRGEGGWQREATLSRDEVAVVTEVPSGGTMGILIEDPDGGMWSLALRPLLPDEIAD